MSSDESRLREVVTAILEAGDLEELTEKKVRQLAREKTGIDTSADANKQLIHKIVKAFVEEEAEDPIEKKRKRRRKGSDEDSGSEKEEEEEEEEEKGRGKSRKGGKKWKVGDGGELVICEAIAMYARIHWPCPRCVRAKPPLINPFLPQPQLSGKRKLTVGEFKGRLLLSGKRKLTVSEFKGRLLVSIREYYEKGGKDMPSSKGISLPPDQWDKLVRHIDTVQEAIDHLS
ncbi:unnamed protein product [Closterium sp. NIES-53]